MTELIEGALVLVRRSLFLSPEGVTASQDGNSLTVAVNTGSVAYVRQDGSSVQVSGDPWFWGAKSFDAAGVTSVKVANSPGNAGCAGLVVESGVVAADLVTTQIDSLRFGSGAAFAEKVDATVTGGVLTLRDAVRGLGGVRISAPVVLDNNVEIDAGRGDATFTATVDATKKGKQSLTVTALGTTTFDQAVGGQTPLASLLTRGIAPLNIPQSTDTKTIPLYYMPQYSDQGQAQVKYGIDVAIGDNPARTFVFDTGGNGFFAGYNANYWNGVTLSDDPIFIKYTSGNYYDAVLANAVVTIGPEGGPRVSTVQPVQIGAIVTAGNTTTGQTFNFNNQFAPPVDGRFAGDFGAAFGLQPTVSGDANLTSVLFQLPGNLHTGFVVQLGPIGTDPSLTVGITDAMREQFPYAIPVTALTGGGTYPVSNYQVLQQFGFYPQYRVSSTDPIGTATLGTESFSSCVQQCLPTLIDSGAPSTSVRLPGAPQPFPFATPNNSLTPGTKFTAYFPTTQGRSPLTWEFVAGNNGSVDAVNYDPNSGAATTTQNVNTGLNLYNGYDVMFDTEKQVIWLRPNGGQSNVSLMSVTTTGDQSYGQNASLNGTYSTTKGDVTVGGVTTLLGDTTLDVGHGDITFSGTVDGRYSLTAKSTGRTTFVRGVGELDALTSLVTDPGGSTVSAGVTTKGAQTFGDDTTLNGLYQTTSGNVTFDGTATLAGPVSVTAGNGSGITFNSTVDSTTNEAYTLRLTTAGGQTELLGAVGGKNPLGGLGLINSCTTKNCAATVIAQQKTYLDGGKANAGSTGMYIGEGVTARFNQGGVIQKFTASGISFAGRSEGSSIQNFTIANNVYDGIQIAANGGGKLYDYTGTTIANNLIYGNAAFGVETVAPVTGLKIKNNTIGQQGVSNAWGYVTQGPNTHGIVLAPGDYKGSTEIVDNTVSDNAVSGIFAPGGVQGVDISKNTLSNNGSYGVQFTNGDFTGTVIAKNTITGNGYGGINLGAGIGQGGGLPAVNPKNGYFAYSDRYDLAYTNAADLNFYDPKQYPSDPKVAIKVGDGTGVTLAVNLDTGSRGLYFDQESLPSTILTDPSNEVVGPGSVYLNSSNRLYFGQWVKTKLEFPDSVYQSIVTGTDPTKRATARIPILVVQAVGASETPEPGQTQASTTFGTKSNSGSITITNGSQTAQAAIAPNPQSPNTGIVTIPGGWYARFADNPGKLQPVANFGVGFDRSGQGTSPTGNGINQEYNAFLNLSEMTDGSMRRGYVISTTGVTLGLDGSVDGFAYTDLTPTGLTPGADTAPDWQPATGTITNTVKVGKDDVVVTGTGPVVLDMGYPGGILTLPGVSGPYAGKLTVDLLNSNGKVSYNATPNPSKNGTTDRVNLLSPNGIDQFNPLAGVYSQNTPPLSQAFFNTGREAFAGLDYLYDADAGYLGLKVGSQQASDAFYSAQTAGIFNADYYKNPNLPTGVTNLTIEQNTIANNGRPKVQADGVYLNGAGSQGVSILSNSIYGNTGQGITLAGGANDNQPTPAITSAKYDGTTLTVTGNIAGSDKKDVNFQVFGSPAGGSGSAQGQTYLGELQVTVDGTAFTVSITPTQAAAGNEITVTATTGAATKNTSQFSNGKLVEG